MKIGGFRRFSMLDYPGKFCAIVFTQGCNFRCPYCHNPELVDPQRFEPPLPEWQVLDFLEKRRGKLNAVTVTGGEPLMQEDILEFLATIKKMNFAIKLDTNGFFSDLLAEILKRNLVDYLAMDLKAPLDLYSLVTQSKFKEEIITHSMDIIRKSGVSYEFRTTLFDKVLSWQDLDRVKELLQPGDKYFVQQCRYNQTLANLEHRIPDDLRLPSLSDDPAGSELLNWGKEHSVRIELRSL